MLESDTKFGKKNDLWFENWHEEFGKFSPEHTKVAKLGLLLGPFNQSRKCRSLKFTRVLCVTKMKNGTKFEKKLTCLFQIDMSNLTNFDASTQKISKIWTLMGFFWPKYIMFKLRKYRRVMFDGIQDWYKGKLTCGSKNDMRNLANFH